VATRTRQLLSCDGGATTVVLSYDDVSLLIASLLVTVAVGSLLGLRARKPAGTVIFEQTFAGGTQTTVPFQQTGANRNFLIRWATAGLQGLGWETF
jgi:hypothetical protein